VITRWKLEIYARYRGDIDWLVRSGPSDDQAGVSVDEWGRIDELVRALTVVERGLAAETFSQRTQVALETEVEAEARPRLRRLAVEALSWP
jgi:hypothetical protein